MKAIPARRSVLLAASAMAGLLLIAGAASAAPPTGNPDGTYPVPPAAHAIDISNPDLVIGNGTPSSRW
ncbi:MAG: hypothetical protein ACRDWS_08550 [Acidimicrobiia bacterium]